MLAIIIVLRRNSNEVLYKFLNTTYLYNGCMYNQHLIKFFINLNNICWPNTVYCETDNLLHLFNAKDSF